MIRQAAILFILLAPSAVAAPLDDYERMAEHRFAPASQLAAGGVTLRRESATWTLESGTIRLMEPLPDGRVTGFVFEGAGTFRMAVPDPVELVQLRRFSKRPGLEQLAEPFTRLVCRSSEDVRARLGLAVPAAPYGTDSVAEKRHQHWYVDHFTDVDALASNLVSSISSHASES